MAKISSAAFDKIQTSTLLALGHIFDKTVAIIEGAITDDSRQEPANINVAKPTVISTQSKPVNKEKALDFVIEKAPTEVELPKSKQLSGLNKNILDVFVQQLPSMKSSASSELRQAYTQLSTHQSRKLSQQASDGLQLVSYDAMELQIVLSHFENVLLKHFQLPLAMLCMRFEHICKREVSLSRLPISPTMLGHIFLNTVIALDLSTSDKKSLLMALLSSLKNVYKPLLEQTNSLFLQHNILPKLSKNDILVQQKRENQRQQAEQKRKQLLGISASDSQGLNDSSAQLSQFLQQLTIPSSAEQHIVFSKQGAPRINRQELAKKVNLINETPITEDNGVYRKLATEKNLVQQLNSKAQLEDYGLSVEANKTISLMSMTFERLLANDNIPEAIKALLAQLQSPLLKAAIQDQMFLADTENPAQKLFNSITEASVSWSPETNPENDSLYKKMSAVVDKVSSDFDDDYLIFDEAIADFFNFREDEQEKTTQLESRIVDRETSQARLKNAQQIAQRHIQKKFDKLQLPESINDFLRNTWQQALFFIYNKEHSKDSVAWQDAIAIEDSLLTNLSNKQADDVEVFLMVLEEKLHDCSIAASDIKKHILAIKDALAAEHAIDLDDLASDTEIDDEDDTTSCDNQEDADLLSTIVVGSWLQKNDQNPPLKIKVAAHIKFNDSYVMVLRNGMKEGSYNGQQLIELLKNKTLQVVKTHLQFESALESVISGMR